MEDLPGLHDEWLDGTVGPQFGGGPIDLKSVSAAWEPGEAVLWVGRPSPAAIFRRSISAAFIGLLVFGFALLWATAVIRGGGNWDRGKAVPPYAAHNLLVAAGAVLWFGLCTAPMIARPWRARRAARSTAYVLTVRRALIVEPGPGKAPRISAFPPEKLAGVRVSERPDGSGDLVFEEARDWNWDRRREAVGFLGLDDVRQVEGLITKHLGVEIAGR